MNFFNTIIMAADNVSPPDITPLKDFAGDWGGWILTIIAGAAIIAFAIAMAVQGTKFHFAKGEERRSEIKTTIVYNFIGLVVATAGTAIFAVVSAVFGA